MSNELPTHTFPGCYPIFYIDEHNNVLCPTCANEHKETIVNDGVNWEDHELYCDNCSKLIESAY